MPTSDEYQLSGVDLKSSSYHLVQENEEINRFNQLGRCLCACRFTDPLGRLWHPELCHDKGFSVAGIRSRLDRPTYLVVAQLDQILYATDFPNLDIIESGQIRAKPNRSLAKAELHCDDGCPSWAFWLHHCRYASIGVVIDAAIIAQLWNCLDHRIWCQWTLGCPKSPGPIGNKHLSWG